jgi:hypothetical protein
MMRLAVGSMRRRNIAGEWRRVAVFVATSNTVVIGS